MSTYKPVTDPGDVPPYNRVLSDPAASRIAATRAVVEAARALLERIGESDGYRIWPSELNPERETLRRALEQLGDGT